MKIYGVYGASGYGREVMPLLKNMIIGEDNVKLYFLDDSGKPETINGYDILTFEQFVNVPADQKFISIAIADSKIRQKLHEKCLTAGISVLDIVAEQHVQMDEIDIGEGIIASPYTIFTSNIRIGKQFHCNIYSYVAHDCIIGDYVTFAPSVRCNGNVHIDDHAYIGTGAIIKQGTTDKPLKIGKGAVVGMGAVVTKDVPAGATVIGNPAKPMIR